MIPFRVQTHSRLLGAIILLGAAGAGCGWEALRATVREEPAVVAAPVLASAAPEQRAPAASPKQARLQLPAAAGSDLARIDMLEARMDGSFAEYTYFRTDIDLDTPQVAADDKAQPAPQQAFAERPGRPGAEDVFAAVLRDVKPVRSNRIAGMPLAYADFASGGSHAGKPVNVSLSVKQQAEPVSRVALMPKRDEVIEEALGGLQVPAFECQRLTEALSTSTLHFGDAFEVILADHSDGKHIVMARLQKPSGEDTILARVEDQSFQRITKPALYERLKREAIANQQDNAVTVEADAAPDLKAETSFAPLLVKKMLAAHVPAKIIVEVVDLARKNGIKAASHDDLTKKINLVFREGRGRRELISVSFNTKDGERKFYRYKFDKAAPAEFFDAQGHSVSKLLLANPVPGGRLGDGFAWRIHPILRVRKHHDGVDYAGPMGSPILAAGDGTVELISWQPGYGRYVRVRHDQGYFTTYAHIARAAKGLAVGQRVTQGQTIAYVGSTGLSTGPHLYYELRKDNRYLDPTATPLPAGTVLSGASLDDFRRQADQIDGMGKLIGVSDKSAHAPDHG
ncbi:M23 family metallopeptidase [Rhizobium sp. C4]|uniref:M23 family metallopeptidase n=1 Tax=Rhizobium sp. C4 TaxID=1349800 RepID=UPI001E4BBC3C|nr:M23 family metallopeptidase [Rhizobium sp. C4]MCD2174345.1 peptidoglycan DD-metalloendopeptidase family protein [Rhizobium sp. C4]